MKHSDSSPTDSASPERLVKELEAMRDAAVRLSLALADFHFCAETSQRTDGAKAVAEILARVEGATLNGSLLPVPRD